MNTKFALIAAIAASLSLSAVVANAAGDAGTKSKMDASDCFGCHAVDKKLVGPSFEDIAKKYKGQKGVEAKLADKIIKGGKGNWDAVTGGIAMTPHANLSKTDAEAMAKWVMAQ